MSGPPCIWPSWGGSPIRVGLRDHETECGDLRVGPGHDPQVLVLVHAALLDRHMWAAFTEHLRRELAGTGSWRVVGYDLRGHGAAAAAPPITGIDQLATDLWELVDTLQVDRVHLAGVSFGGAVAQMAALTTPGRVTSLTLASTSSRFPPEVMERRAQLSEGGVAAELPETLQRWFRPDTLRAGGPAVEYARRSILATAPEHWAQTWRTLGRFDVTGRLPEIHTPVLTVAGADDKASPPSALRRIAEDVRHARSVVIDGASHLFAMERPDAMASCAGAFLRDLDR